MAAPVLLVEFTTDPPDDTTPTWTDVTEHVRSFSTSRGRDTELSLVEAGTATITLNNRSRDFDPASDATLRPMNRWKISVVMDGPVTEEVFVGYAESYDQQWPAVGKDAVTIVQCVDEFKVLALDNVPTTNPPRDTYQELVLFDNPEGYWPMAAPNIFEPVRGDRVEVGGGSGYAYQVVIGPIVGDSTAGGYAITLSNWYYIIDHSAGGAGDAGGESEFTAEGWFRLNVAAPGSTEVLFAGPETTDATYSWRIGVNTSRQFTADAKNSGGTTVNLVGTTAATLGDWYHVVTTITDGMLRLYVNGVEEDSDAWSGTFELQDEAGDPTWIGNGGVAVSGSGQRNFDELAWYRFGLSAERILAHYQAGAERGFAYAQDPGDRLEDVLDSANNTATRNIQTGTREMTGTYMIGQSVLDEARKSEQAENVDAVLFVAKDGTITFLADGHRSSSPYDTVQATFNDDGTGLHYQDIDVDYSDSFLFNEWNVTREGGTTTTATDADSISAFLKRSQSRNNLPITTESDQEEIADALLAKYKDPMFRVTGLDLLATETVAEAVFPLDIGARIRAIRHAAGAEYLYPATDLYPSTTLYPLEGPLDQESFIQKIDTSGTPGRPIQVRLSVSPL